MNIGELYRSYKRWRLIGWTAYCLVPVGLAMMIATVLASGNRPDLIPIQSFFLIFGAGLFCGGFIMLFTSIHKTSPDHPLHKLIPLIDRWLELKLGTVDEFPLDNIDREKSRGSAEEILQGKLAVAFTAAEGRDELKQLLRDGVKKPTRFSDLKNERKQRQAFEDTIAVWIKKTDGYFAYFYAIWDFFKDMNMLPMKNVGKKPRPYKDANEFIKDMKRKRAEAETKPEPKVPEPPPNKSAETEV